jgi:predicted amidophosphoribosyltransferase
MNQEQLLNIVEHLVESEWIGFTTTCNSCLETLEYMDKHCKNCGAKQEHNRNILLEDLDEDVCRDILVLIDKVYKLTDDSKTSTEEV